MNGKVLRQIKSTRSTQHRPVKATQKRYNHKIQSVSKQERRMVRDLMRRAHGNKKVKDLFELYVSKNVAGRHKLIVALKRSIRKQKEARAKQTKKNVLNRFNKGLAIGPETFAEYGPHVAEQV